MKNIVIKPIALCSTLVIIEIHTVIHKETIGVPMKKLQILYYQPIQQ